MKLPRWLISSLLLLVLVPAGLACGGSVDLPPTPTATRVPVLVATVAAAPTTVAQPEATATDVPPAPTATQPPPPAGVLSPLDTPTDPASEATATPAPQTTSSDEGVTFDPPQLVQGGATVVYLNTPATSATMTFGGLQYPMVSDGTRWWTVAGIGAFANPGVAPVTIAYNPADGSPQASVESSIEIVPRDFPVENIDLDPTTSTLLDPAIVNNEEALRASIFAGFTMQRLWNGTFQAPSSAPLSDTYGIARSYNGGPVTSYHRGTDFAGAQGDPVYAAAAGKVVFADAMQVRGNAVIIDHGVGVYTTYNHLSAIDVSVGDTVEAGQLLGLIGSTGLVTGPHLHWEVVVRGIEVDGQLWLSGAINPQ